MTAWGRRKFPDAEISLPHNQENFMRVVCVTHYFPSRDGGIETVAFEINKRLAKKGHQVEWFASQDGSPGCNIEHLHYRPVKAMNFLEKMTGLPLPIWLSKDVLKLWSSIRECNVVHVHDFIYPGSILSIAFARYWRKNVILTQHIGDIPYKNKVLRFSLFIVNKVLAKIALRSASQVAFISNSVEKYYRSFCDFKSPPSYIPNGVDRTIFHPVSEVSRKTIREALALTGDVKVCLFVGRFVEKKGLAILARLVRATPTIQWIFAGSGPLHPKDWHEKNVKTFEGLRRERLADLYRAADLLVLPSQGEGFPLVIQESFACGTPALVSDETALGCEEARPYLFELSVIGNKAVEEWEKQLSYLCTEPNLLRNRREAVLEFAKHAWDWDQAIENYSRLYREKS